jgi:cyclopropane-fatty-acyl-phospholipid synthase
MNKKSRFNIDQLDNIGLHYAATLACWREKLLHEKDKILKLGFDETFIRKWDYYFAYCQAGFTARILGNLQMVLSRPKE